MNLSIATEIEKSLEDLFSQKEQEVIDKSKVKSLKNLCKQHNDIVEHTFFISYPYLKKDSCKTRILCLQLFDELFLRSHQFRTLVLSEVEEFCSLILGTNKNRPLPKPSKEAKKLKEFGLRTFKKWHHYFKSSYIKLDIIMDYLTNVKRLNFDSIDLTEEETNGESLRNTLINKKKEQTKRLIKNLKKDIQNAITEVKSINVKINNIFNLLTSQMLFTSKDFENINKNGKKSDFTQDDLRLFAIPTNGYNIELDPNKLHSVTIEETEDNSCLINELNDCIESTKQVYLPKLIKLINVASDENAPTHVIEAMTTSKEALENKLSRYTRLIIIRNDPDEDTADFEEVEEDTSLLDDIPSCSSCSFEKLVAGQNQNQRSFKDNLKDKLHKSSTLKEMSPVVLLENNLSSSDKEKLDGYTKSLNFGSSKQFGVDHKLLNSNSLSHTDQQLPDATLSHLKSKTIELNGVFEPVTHICGVRLPSGKLCSRQDRYKCPFHGKIVKRDEKGNVLFKEDSKEEKSKFKKDVDFLMDVVSTSNGNYKLIPKVNTKKTLKGKISKPSSCKKRLKKKISNLKH